MTLKCSNSLYGHFKRQLKSFYCIIYDCEMICPQMNDNEKLKEAFKVFRR